MLPSGCKDPNSRVLGPKYRQFSNIWARKVYYLGPWTFRVEDGIETLQATGAWLFCIRGLEAIVGTAARHEAQDTVEVPCEPLSKLQVFPLISPVILPYIIPYITPFKEFRL